MTAQTILALGAVAAAVVYLLVRALRLFRGKKAGCGGSCACPTTAAKPDDLLVALDTQRLRSR